MDSIDYLRELDVDVIEKHGLVRVIGKELDVYFGDEDPVDLKNAVNKAMGVAISHYRENNAEIFLTEKQLYELSAKVVLHHLYIYSNWRRTNEKYKNHELAITMDDLLHVQSNDICYQFCKNIYGTNFREVAAALMGKSLTELKEYEVSSEKFANR